MDTNQPGRRILDARQMRRTIRRMAVEIVEQNVGVEGLMLVGIRTRGVCVAEEIRREIEETEGTEVPLGILDITLYRDDLSTIAPQPIVKSTKLPGQIDDQCIVLCDDVLYTGRTVRAALDALMDYGRPRVVRMVVLVDRGLRELPIQADIVGHRMETLPGDLVEVCFPETDYGREEVRLTEGRRVDGAPEDVG